MIEQEKIEQLNSLEISSGQLEKVEVSPEKPPLASPSQRGRGSRNDDQQQKIQDVKQGIRKIGEDNQESIFKGGNVPDIKTIEDLLSIKETEAKFKALLKLADKGEKEEEKALDFAKEIWEGKENAVLLDELRDKLASK